MYALTTHQLQVERRESHRANQVYALTTHQLQVERRERVIKTIKCMRSPHTSYRWRGERDIEPIKCMRSPHTIFCITLFNSTIVSLSILREKDRMGYKLMILSRGKRDDELFFFIRTVRYNLGIVRIMSEFLKYKLKLTCFIIL